MAQDATYQTKVYHEREGERLVAASGGTFAVESVGSLAIYSGAQMTIESGANLELAGGDLAGDDMRRLLVSEWGDTVIINSGPITKLALSNVPKNARIVTIVANDTMVAGSIWMTSVSAGRELLLRLVGDLTGTFTADKTKLSVNMSGCKILNSLGGAVAATMQMNTSGASDCFILFKAVADDVWAVVAEGGHPTES